MSATIGATALSAGAIYEDPRLMDSVVITSNTHGFQADSQLFFSDIDNGAGTYFADKMRYLKAVATNTMTVLVDEGYTAGTPAGSEAVCAGWVQDSNYYFHGFKLHLASADAGGATLTLTADSKKAAYFDTLIYSKVMTGVTDLIYMPEVPVPLVGGDILKFAWANTAIVWGCEILVSDRG